MGKYSWIVDKGGVPRTGGSSLTADELVVCDALFGADSTSLGFLLHEDFNLAFNLPYGAFGSVAMSLVEGMANKGIVGVTEREQEQVVCLTTTGRAAWEIERRPVWDAYCYPTRGPGAGNWLMQVRSIRPEVADAYVKAWVEASGGPSIMVGSATKKEEHGRFPFWRTGRFVTVELSLSESRVATEYAVLTRHRIWWTGVTELLESHRALNGDRGLPPLFGASD
jgi:hypothetical protein